jgi:uncharacterized protein (TIGR03382 family)
VSDHSYVVVSVEGDAITAEAKLVDGGVIERFSLPSAACSAPDAGAPDGGAADARPPAAPRGTSCSTLPAAALALAPLLALLLALVLRRRRS